MNSKIALWVYLNDVLPGDEYLHVGVDEPLPTRKQLEHGILHTKSALTLYVFYCNKEGAELSFKSRL